jgi:hypothetical protein
MVPVGSVPANSQLPSSCGNSELTGRTYLGDDGQTKIAEVFVERRAALQKLQWFEIG